MVFITRAGGVMALLTVPEVPIFRSGGIISAKDFNAIPDEEGDTILWGKGKMRLPKQTGLLSLKHSIRKQIADARTQLWMKALGLLKCSTQANIS